MCFYLFYKEDKRIYFVEYSIKRNFVSRDVVFYEHVFPYQRVEDTSNETNSLNIHDQIVFIEDQPFLSEPSRVIFAPCDNIENNVNNDMNQTFISLKKFVPIETKTSIKIMKQHS